MVQRGGIFNYNGFSAGSDSIRIEQNQIALQMIARHPFFGVGYQQFTYTPEFNDFNSAEAITMVHNSLLLVGAESGIFALGCLVAFFWIALRRGWRADSEVGACGLAVGVAFCLIANSDFYPYVFQYAKMSLFLMLGLMLAQAQEGEAFLDRKLAR
jgi:O-antigen ligase